MRVLFYVGYQKERFDKSTYLDHGIGGSEYCVIKLSQQFSDNGHNVIVSGDVYTEYIDGVSYVNMDDLDTDQHFDVVIATNYINYVQFLEDINVTYDKSIFWMHNTEFYPYYNGDVLPNDGMDYLLDDRVNKIVGVSEYHANKLKRLYPKVSHKITHIDNAIDLEQIDYIPVPRIEDKFVYTSAADRGLRNLLDMWPDIKKMKPNATLYVATPPYGLEWYKQYIEDLDGVYFLGSLSPTKLYETIKSSEYWVYPSQYDETYCITALEMMACGVKIISTDTGNLKNLLSNRGGVVNSEVDVDIMKQSILDTLQFVDSRPDIQQNNLRSARNYAEGQTWGKRYTDWEYLVKTCNRLYPELYSYYRNSEEWSNRFLTYSIRTKEWDLITDEPFLNCFSFPLFTPEFCKMIREEAEHSKSWTVNRHDYYPTTDMVLETIDMHDIYMEVLREYVMPLGVYMWALEGKGWDDLNSENFLAKYVPSAQGHLSIHHDSSDITCLVQLSDEDEYEGGGTWFRRQKELIKNPIGYATLHPGNITHKHGARAVTKGTRYIIVSFMNNTER